MASSESFANAVRACPSADAVHEALDYLPEEYRQDVARAVGVPERGPHDSEARIAWLRQIAALPEPRDDVQELLSEGEQREAHAEAAQREKATEAQAHLEEAIRLRDAGDPDGKAEQDLLAAEQLGADVLAVRISLIRLHLQRGMELAKADKVDEAERAAQQAADLGADVTELRSRIARCPTSIRRAREQAATERQAAAEERRAERRADLQKSRVWQGGYQRITRQLARNGFIKHVLPHGMTGFEYRFGEFPSGDTASVTFFTDKNEIWIGGPIETEAQGETLGLALGLVTRELTQQWAAIAPWIIESEASSSDEDWMRKVFEPIEVSISPKSDRAAEAIVGNGRHTLVEIKPSP